MNRSGTQACPICERAAKLVEHHIEGRSISSDYVAWICPICHDDVHAGDLIIEGIYQTTNGIELIWRREEDQPIVADGAQTYQY